MDDDGENAYNDGRWPALSQIKASRSFSSKHDLIMTLSYQANLSTRAGSSQSKQKQLQEHHMLLSAESQTLAPATRKQLQQQPRNFHRRLVRVLGYGMIWYIKALHDMTWLLPPERH